MKLSEALGLVRDACSTGPALASYLLVVGSSPVSLKPYFHAYLLKQASPPLTVETSPYGDLVGALEQSVDRGYAGFAVVCEWFDLDPRLGYRRLGGWGPAVEQEILQTVQKACCRLWTAIEAVSHNAPVAVVLPTLSPAPLGGTAPCQEAEFQSILEVHLAELSRRCACSANVRLAARNEIDRLSPPGQRFDLRTELHHGCPYTLRHAEVLGMVLARLLGPLFR
ncbi:MAG: hypothetical protein ACK5AZ_16710 [Bryobacteraceae bacterium]